MNEHSHFTPFGALRGILRPPADKSISHRAAMIAAMGEGETEIVGYLDAADTRSTLAAVQAVGARLVRDELATDAVGEGDGLGAPSLRIAGVGLRGARPAAIDVGNAGTLLRLLPGWLAGQPEGTWTLDGDESIRKRPVDRVAAPLGLMGARLARPRGAPAAARGRGRAAPRDHLRAAGGERPGEVVPALRRAPRGGRDARGRAAADPRPHRAHAHRRRRRGAPRWRHRRRQPRRAPRAGPHRRPRRLLLGRLLHRRRDDRPRQRRPSPRRRPQPDPHRPADDPRADGGEQDRGDPEGRGGRRADRRHPRRPLRPARLRGRRRRRAAGDRRAAAGRARRLLRRGDDDDPRRGRAAPQGVRPDRRGRATRCGRSAARSSQPRTGW